MARIFTDALVEEVLRAFATNEGADLPSPKLLAALAKASGKMEGSVKDRYVELAKQQHGPDYDPYLLPPPTIG